MAEPVARTERLLLRGWDEADLPAFLQATNTPTVMRWLGGVMDSAAQAALLERVMTCQARNGFCFWIVERIADGAMLGFCGLKRADAPGSSVSGEMEVGWRLREDAWGQGYAREAATAALDLGFGRFGADRIVALTVPGNAASQRLMQRLGMQRRTDLDYQDCRFGPDLNPTIVHLISASQWEANS
ncbi:GNAT family N-acetyltransferase [Sphingobium lignivorans]|uniref:RimJ/RimL family protein N-acetyltransferase n=1 Tax=Sphingobium lignivorans TaxID=2735886 RepID=A0ABR6NCX6_9SPHN|nr:GNAT family N-acetyltransferase [Sphingobium lignivorans]MBB5984084.1 RimJ/RimL family protein N-acetyltransferase [Sphingobium lignivorans]